MRRPVTSMLLGIALSACAGVQQAGPSSIPADGGRRRSVAMAVPPDARMALIAEKPWSRSANQREAAGRLGLGKEYGAVFLVLSGMAGFDVTDPAEVQAHGFDSEAGLALFTLPPDEGLVLAIGVADPERAQQIFQRALTRLEHGESGEKLSFETTTSASGARVTVGRRAGGGAQIGYLLHGGYLYARRTESGDPLPALLRIAALPPEQGLEREPGYLAAARRVGPADLVAYVAELPAEQKLPSGVRFIGGVALALDVLPERIRLRFSGHRQSDAEAGAQPLPPREPRIDLAAGLPAGAVVWMQLSCSPQLLWRETVRSAGADPVRVAEGLQAFFGPQADREVLPSFTGNFAMAIYPSAARLAGKDLAPSADPSVLVIVAELAAGNEGALEAVLDRGTETLSKRTPMAVQRRTAGGAPLWRLGGDALVAAVREERLFIASPMRMASPDAPARTAAGDGTRREKGPGNRPPRWPAEATKEELGALAAVLRPDARQPSLREELRKAGAAGIPAAEPLLISVTGAILDVPRLLRTIREVKGEQAAGFDQAEAFLRGHHGALHQARFDWRLGREALEAELQFALPRTQAPAAERSSVQAPQGGRLREAVQEARRLTAAHPEEARSHVRLADVLLKVAAGEAAREEARRAASLAPAAGAPLVHLGWVLEHDPLGQRWHAGLDFPGAEAALRKAKELDPKDFGARIELALLLERGPAGQRDSSLARPTEAAAEIRSLRERLKTWDLNGRLDERLLEAEFFAGLWNEVLADAPAVPLSEARDALALAARAAAQGPAAAAKDAELIPKEARRTALVRGAQLLESARLYAGAADLLREAAAGATDSEALSRRALHDSNLVRFDGPEPAGDPVSLVRQAAVAAYDPEVPAERLARFLAGDWPLPPRSIRSALLPFSAVRRSELLAGGFTALRFRDAFQSFSRIRREGDRDSGWRIEVRPENEAKADLWWVIEEHGEPKILCHGRCTGTLGAHALELIGSGKAEGARRVLDWMRDSLSADTSERDGTSSLFISLWNGEPQRLQLAAAAAAAGSNRPAPAIPVLAAAAGADADPARRDRLRVALGRAHLGAKDAEAALRAVEGIDPANPDGLAVRIFALHQLKRDGEAERLIDGWLRSAPDDPLAIWHSLRRGVIARDLPHIEAAARKLIAKGRYTAEAQNTLAWAMFCDGRMTEEALELARAASKSAPDPARLNTLAALSAETGRLEEAREAVARSIDAADEGGPRMADRYVLARIWEGYGLDDLAAPEYSRLSKEDAAEPPAGARCIAAAARRRLASLAPAVQ